jgi:tetratricopeptide (TPR) repeat protein
MKIIRWFLSHLLLILLIVAVIYGYMFWGNLAGENTPVGKAITYLSNEFVEVGEFVNAVKAKHAQVSAEHADESLEANASASAEVNKKPDDSSVVEKDIVTADSNQKPVSKTHNDAQVEQKLAGFIEQKTYAESHVVRPGKIDSNSGEVYASDKNTPSSAVTGHATGQQRDVPPPPASDAFIPEEVAKQIDNVDEKGKVIDPSLPVSDVRSSWLNARKSFYQRKYDVSEKNYQYVIDHTEDNFDAYGELGNVYFNQGKNKQAAAAYFSAASILVSKGQIRRAESLIGLLRHLDKDKAEELQKLITSATSASS